MGGAMWDSKIKGRSSQGGVDAFSIPDFPSTTPGAGGSPIDQFLANPDQPISTGFDALVSADMPTTATELQDISDFLNLAQEAKNRGRPLNAKPVAQDFAVMRGVFETPKALVQLNPPVVQRVDDMLATIKEELKKPHKGKVLLDKISAHYFEQRKEIEGVIAQARATLKSPDVTAGKIARETINLLKKSLAEIEFQTQQLALYRRTHGGAVEV